MKILHLLVDDKFIDSAIREFEAVSPGLHEYLILEATPPFRHLRSPMVQALDRSGWRRRIAQADVAALVLHGLPAHHYPLLEDIAPGPTVIWLGWGYDYYGLISDAYPQGLLLPATTALLSRIARRVPQHAPGVMRASELALSRPYPRPTQREQAVLARVDFFSPVLDTEHALVRRHQPTLRARHLSWNYLTLEDDLVVERCRSEGPGPDLLIGNNASPTNNHLEVFEQLRARGDLDGRRLVVPLSYGDPHYARVLSEIGRQMFGAAFVPLLDFMPKDEYIALLNSCGTVLMNPLRQQALGNVMISGLLGARIFLNARSPMMRWLQRRGLQVEDIARLDLAPLGTAERAANAAAIAAFAGRSVRRRATAALVEQALARSCEPAPTR